VVEHRFDPVEAAEWRNARLDFDTLPDLLRSLTVAPGVRGLNLTQPALDETLLRRLIKDEEVARVGRSRGAIMRLWEACQLPDFQKTTLDEHGRLSKDIFQALTGKRGRLTQDWIAPRFAELDRDDGQIDQLSARLSGVRTLSYIANRPDWLDQAHGWRDRTKALEERLSDVLHERLTARFVDRRTTALMRALNVREDAVADVDEEGAVIVEGHAVGRLTGVDFQIDKGSSALEDRALRHAARQAVTPEIARRLGRLAADADEAFGITPDGALLWRGVQAGQVAGGDWFAPRVRLLGELGPTAARERAQRRLEAWLAGEAGRLKTAIESGALKGLPRGLAFRLLESGGVIDRRDIERDLAALSQVERRTLRTFGVRMGAHSVWLPALLKDRPRALARAFVAGEPFRPRAAGLSILPEPPPSARALAAFGLRAAGRFAAPVELLEALTERRARGKGVLSAADLSELGVTLEEAKALGAALKATRARQSDRDAERPPLVKDSPFAALSALTAQQPAPARTRRRNPRRAGTGGTPPA
jgi:ATP-dependent RNA helicase SUPV3L1/SUV3